MYSFSLLNIMIFIFIHCFVLRILYNDATNWKCFQFEAMINKASINILVQMVLRVIFSFLSVMSGNWDCWIYSMRKDYIISLSAIYELLHILNKIWCWQSF